MRVSSNFNIIKEPLILILKSPFYVFIALVSAFLMVSFSVLILNLQLIFDSISPSYTFIDRVMLVFNLLGGIFTNNTAIGIALMIAASLLAGINVALLAFKLKKLRSANCKESGLGAGGTIASILASGCSSCGISILSLIGIAGALTFLPFRGLEIGAGGIIILLFSIYWTSKSICAVKSPKCRKFSTSSSKIKDFRVCSKM